MAEQCSQGPCLKAPLLSSPCEIPVKDGALAGIEGLRSCLPEQCPPESCLQAPLKSPHCENSTHNAPLVEAESLKAPLKRPHCEISTQEDPYAEIERLRTRLREAEQRIKELEEEYQWQWTHVRVSSPLTTAAHCLTRPSQSGWCWKWFEGFCPCCKRPVDVTMLRSPPWCNGGSPYHRDPAPERHAYVVALWGMEPGYVLGAMVLAARLRELGTRAEFVLLHTDDVPPGHLQLLATSWKLRLVDYVDGARGLFAAKGHRFDGVFTKVHAWALSEYTKALLLDIDLIPLAPLDDLFELNPPAAFVRGAGDDLPHGAAVDGRGFFIGEYDQDWAWWQGGGINAGVILLKPCAETYGRMLREVTSELHPEHVPGNGPEQDYFSRFFASAPWHHIGVKYNFQLHHIPFSLERVLGWRAAWAAATVAGTANGIPQKALEWLPPRLKMPLEEVRNVHFSGQTKLWHRFLPEGAGAAPEVDVLPQNDEAFAEEYLRANLEGYSRWIVRDAPAEEYADRGCRLMPEGRIALHADGTDVTDLVDLCVSRTRAATLLAARVWRECAERLLERTPGLLEAALRPELPPGSPWPPGTQLEALWQGNYWPCVLLGVHPDGACVIRFGRSGEHGPVERRVERARLRENCEEVAFSN